MRVDRDRLQLDELLQLDRMHPPSDARSDLLAELRLHEHQLRQHGAERLLLPGDQLRRPGRPMLPERRVVLLPSADQLEPAHEPRVRRQPQRLDRYPTGGGSSVKIDTTSTSVNGDVDGCPSSFSAEITTVAGTASPQISQCVAVSAGSTYLYGASMSNGDNPTETLLCNEVYCALTWWTGSGCSGSDITASDPYPLSWEDFQWSDDTVGESDVAPANAASAKVTCYTDTPYSGSTCIGHFDKIFLDLNPHIY